MNTKYVVFVVNLLQDVNILRPLIYMTGLDMQLRTDILITDKFLARDNQKIWQSELQLISEETCSPIHIFSHTYEAVQLLEGKSGYLVAASESCLGAHSPTHDLFRCAQSGFLTITLQHGYECVGFLQSQQHNLAHGTSVTFGADVVCGWFGLEKMVSMSPSQQSKLLVTGPTCVLQQNISDRPSKEATGIVCENLHSVRLNASVDLRAPFINTFSGFCKALDKQGRRVVLRPHPGGQYVLKNKVELPRNSTLNNLPMYRVSLSDYAYGISAPSSVLIDMVLAGIPTAVWKDGSGVMDMGNYSGLTEISSIEEWLQFSGEAVENPEKFIKKQECFLEKIGMATSPETVYKNFRSLFSSLPARKESFELVCESARERVMFVANAYVPTLQLSFVKPLADLVDSGDVTTDFIFEEQMKKTFGGRIRDSIVCRWIEKKLDQFQPTIIVFCRYSGPHVKFMTQWARKNNVPTVFHIDDDLLGIPKDIGEGKYKLHNHPDRLGTVNHLLNAATLVYCSTQKLTKRFSSIVDENRIYAGKVYCSSEIMVPVKKGGRKKVGYMASADHAHNLKMVLPALVRVLEEFDDIELEFFGSISIPDDLQRFSGRIFTAPPISNYNEFLQEFAKREWDVGICPLVPIHFNQMKANTKWVEYTALGIAVIATKDTVYDDCCDEGCGVLAESVDDWYNGLKLLLNNQEARFEQVRRAQEKLGKGYSIENLREQVKFVFERTKQLSGGLEQARLENI